MVNVEYDRITEQMVYASSIFWIQRKVWAHSFQVLIPRHVSVYTLLRHYTTKYIINTVIYQRLQKLFIFSVTGSPYMVIDIEFPCAVNTHLINLFLFCYIFGKLCKHTATLDNEKDNNYLPILMQKSAVRMILYQRLVTCAKYMCQMMTKYRNS